MARYVQSFTTPFTPQQAMNYFCSYMQSEGFSYVNKGNEGCWKKGVGLVSGPQFIKLTQANGVYTLEAWIKFAILPGVYVGEMGVTGAFGAIPKAFLKERVDSLLMALQARPVAYNMNAPQMNMNTNQYNRY